MSSTRFGHAITRGHMQVAPVVPLAPAVVEPVRIVESEPAPAPRLDRWRSTVMILLVFLAGTLAGIAGSHLGWFGW